MTLKKILTIGLNEDNLDPASWEKIRSLAETVVSVPRDGDFQSELADADALLLDFGISITKEDIDAAPNLQYIGCMSTAFGKVDVAHAATKNIPVCNLGGYSTEAVAEFTIAAILEHIRGLGEGKSRPLVGNYLETGIKASELKGKIFGVLGLGNIGSRVAELAQAFGTDTRYWSRSKKNAFEQKGIKYQELDELLKEADFISINLPESSETTELFNEERMQSLKSGSVVINTAPMELVNLQALQNRLAAGDITFILDHSDQMEKADVEALVKFPNCIVYPPIAYITSEARANKQKILIKNIENFLAGNPTNKIN